jgi:hypothetical protein
MAVLAVEPTRLPTPLPGPYADPPDSGGLEPHPATVGLVRGLVRQLLLDSPGFHALAADDRTKLARGLVRVGSYLAECVRDDWYQSDRLDQRPLVRTRAPVAQAQATDFQPSAASQIGGVTTETLRAISFPVFVADLIRGTFTAIQDASQKQMDAYMELLANVSKTVDEFDKDNVSDDNGRAWLAERYPHHLKMDDSGKLVPAPNQPDGAAPNVVADLDLSQSVDLTDQSAIDETLVPAARRKLAQSRLKMLSTFVLMGINRIVVTGGKIRATMGFHINTRDTAHQEHAEGVDFKTGASGSFGAGLWSASASMSFAYVSSTKTDSNADLNTQTDLTGEVELHFQSDYFPIQRFADSGDVDKIRANTPVPAANAPTIPWGDSSPPRAVEPMPPARMPDKTPVATAPEPPKPPPLKDEAKKDEAKKDDAKKPATDTKVEPQKPPADTKTEPPKPPADAAKTDAAKTDAAKPPADTKAEPPKAQPPQPQPAK